MAKNSPFYDVDRDGEMVTMFRITPQQLKDSRIKFYNAPDGAVEIIGQFVPMQFFDPQFVSNFTHQVGEGEANTILDRAGALIQREIFISELRKILE